MINLKQPVHPYVRIGAIAALAISVLTLHYVSGLDTEPTYPGVFNENLEARVTRMEYNQESLNLALEFGFDPMIVQVTRRLAADVLAEENHHTALTWRFIDSEPELTYLILSMIQAESKGEVTARGDSGDAWGLLQMHLPTARQYRPEVTGEQLLTIETHLEVALEHFRFLLEKYSGNYTLAVLAWNRGQGTVDRLLAIGESPKNGYARKVFMEAAVRNGGGAD